MGQGHRFLIITSLTRRNEVSAGHWFSIEKKQGNNLQIDKGPIMSFPIIIPDKQTEKLLIKKVDEIRSLLDRNKLHREWNNNGNENNGSATPDDLKVQSINSEIDEIVYKLYEITSNEKTTVITDKLT